MTARKCEGAGGEEQAPDGGVVNPTRRVLDRLPLTLRLEHKRSVEARLRLALRH